MAAAPAVVEPSRRFAAFLRSIRDELMRQWAQRVLEDPRVPQASRLNEADLRDHIPLLLDTLIDALETERRGEEAGRVLGAGEAAKEHARHRMRQRYRIAEALRELSHLRAAILDTVAAAGTHPEPQVEALLHGVFDESMIAGALEMDAGLQALAQARRESEARLKAIVETAADAILTIDERGTVESFNPAAARIFGYEAREVIGRNVSMLMPEPYHSQHDQYLARYRETGERRIIGVGREVRGRHKNGAIVPLDLAVSETWVEGRRLFTGILRDVSERRQADAERDQLLDSERAARGEAQRAARVRDDFVALVSHELRAPLNAILGWTTMLRSGKLDDAAREKALEVIERNARAQISLVEDLLDLSRIDSGKLRLSLQPVSLAAVVEGAVASHLPAAEAKGISLTKQVDSSSCTIQGDPGRLGQIVSNLLSNAIKFTPRGGRVDVSCRGAGGRVQIVVRDTGKGIAPEFLPHLFERFRQADASLARRQGGLGLGLALVKHLVEQHGGEIRAESAGEGQGATFTVDLPVVPSRRAEIRAGSFPEACLAIKGLRALVVDDEEDARTLVRRILEECDAQVVDTASVIEGLEQLRRMRPCVLISDIGMPDQDGYHLIRAVRALAPEEGGSTPAVAVTAFARPEDELRAIEAGYQAHLAKPFSPSELIVLVAFVTGRLGSPPRENATAA